MVTEEGGKGETGGGGAGSWLTDYADSVESGGLCRIEIDTDGSGVARGGLRLKGGAAGCAADWVNGLSTLGSGAGLFY